MLQCQQLQYICRHCSNYKMVMGMLLSVSYWESSSDVSAFSQTSLPLTFNVCGNAGVLVHTPC